MPAERGSEPRDPGRRTGGPDHRSAASERRLVVAVLRAGLAAAAALMAAGLALAIGEARLTSHPVAVSQVLPFLARGRPSGYLAAGVLVLVATPGVRVLALAAGFARERDWRFAAVAMAVAVILGLGVVVGRA